MPDAEPHRLSATSLARLIEAGELTAEAVVRSCLERIRERDPVVRAWAWLDPEQALDAARACDKGGRRGGPVTRCSGACRSASRTFSIPPTCRPATARRSTAGCRPSFQASAASLPQAAGGDPDRQNRDDRIRQPASRSDIASAQPAAHAGRIVERLGGGGRRFHGAAGDRHADWRLGDPAGRLLRRRRVQAELRAVSAGRHAHRTPRASIRSARWRARSRTRRCSAPR